MSLAKPETEEKVSGFLIYEVSGKTRQYPRVCFAMTRFVGFCPMLPVKALTDGSIYNG